MPLADASADQEDKKPSEDPRKDKVRKALVEHYLDDVAEREVKKLFGIHRQQPHFLIVCNKLLTGFDAPIEGVLYLDNPLEEHNLLQAIARVNRVYGRDKGNGLLVDYIGVSDHLAEALSTYRHADVENAMRDLEEPRKELAAAHREVMAFFVGIQRSGSRDRSESTEYLALMQALGTEDAWFSYSRKAKAFIALYSWLSPDPEILNYTDDLRWIVGSLTFGRGHFEKQEGSPLTDYSAKIRDMLEEHLHVTGLDVTVEHPFPTRFASGGKVLYRGRRLRLVVEVGNVDVPEVEYRSGFLIRAPADLDERARDRAIAKALTAWMKSRIAEDAAWFMRRHAPKLGVEPNGVRIKDQRHLWGSCGRDGVINLNWHLIFAPKPVLEYAVVHELCHLQHRDHSPAFWRKLRTHLPGFASQKAWLASLTAWSLE